MVSPVSFSLSAGTSVALNRTGASANPFGIPLAHPQLGLVSLNLNSHLKSLAYFSVCVIEFLPEPILIIFKRL